MIREAAQTRGRTAVATAAVAGLELAWLYTLLHIVSRGMRLEVSLPSLILVYAASFVVGLGLRLAFRSSRVARLVSWLVWPPATLLLLMVLLHPAAGPADASWTAVALEALRDIPREAEATTFIVLAAGVLWWLGGRLASSRMAYETVVAEFQLGLAVLAGSVFVGYLVGVDQSAAVLTAVLFVGLGLVGAAATRVDEGGGLLFFRQGGTWWGMLLISVGLVLLLGIIAGILFTPELMQFVSRGIRALWGLIERVLDAIAGLFSSSPVEMELPPAPEVLPPQDEGQGFSWGLPEGWLRPSRIVYGVLVGGLALAVAWRIISQLFDWTRRKARQDGVEMESLPDAFWLDVVRLLKRVLAWVSSLFAFGRFSRKEQGEPACTTAVRRLYADMLRWGAKSGFPRGPSQTPFEYQQTL
ncbi:MAG: hypothetical protein JXA87_04095, partial [Thermoleophilia bacterium]|nr:hypothetical protein [Thermoleophilia bacterium]